MYASSHAGATTIPPAEHHPNTETTSSTKKIAYLTFDDGPNKYTTQILNILKEKNGKQLSLLLVEKYHIIKRQCND